MGHLGHIGDIYRTFWYIFVEAAALNLMDEDEYYRILGNALAAGRVYIGILLNYVRRRKLRTEELIERIKSI